MLFLISPAKNLDFDTPTPKIRHTKARFLDESQSLIQQLTSLAPHDISTLMHISDKLGALNYDRFQSWHLPFTTKNARQAIFAFKGDVYVGLDAYNLSSDELTFAQSHMCILSGLYGVLRPLDLMQAYRLEMGTKFANTQGKNLYEFWGDKITQHLNKQLKSQQADTLINLASNEYFKAVKKNALNASVITPIFKDEKNGKLKIISFFAKKARGRMSAYIIKNKLTHAEPLKAYNWDGYTFNSALSTDNDWVFTRKEGHI